ncbi:MAG: hypothetical protein DMF82_25600 [Acidobacteria bacterium]|nr:MAG: hypothetical protein DMF82_25600 [Acidobacteriota bacterium]
MILATVAVGLLNLGYLGTGQASDTSAGAAALARLRGLAGEWQGSVEWSGARKGTGSMNAIYSLTGNGSAVVESLVTAGESAMTSVYHLDGADLRMTHFCGAQNQPRLKARTIDLGRGVIDFAFVDATNLRSPVAGHVHGVEMRLVDDDHITLTFLFEAGGQKSRERIALKRLRRT